MSSSRIKKRTSHAADTNATKRKKKSKFVVDMPLKNDLPPVPMMPKCIKVPWKPERLYNYHLSTLEQKYQYRVHMEPTIGLPIHFIDPTTAEDTSTSLHKADEILLRRDNEELLEYANGQIAPKTLSSFGTSLSVRRIYEANNVRKGKHWLRRTVYMDNNQLAQQNNQISGTEEMLRQTETLNRLRKQEEINSLPILDRIDRSFEVAKEKPVHLRNPKLKPVRIFNIVPDFAVAEQPLYHAEFDPAHNIFDGIKSKKEQLDDDEVEPVGADGLTEDQSKLLAHSILHPCTETGADNSLKLLIPDTPSDYPGEKFFWARDYELATKMHKHMRSFVFLWDKDDLAQEGTTENPFVGNVVFGELENKVLHLDKKVVGRYDVKKSRELVVSVQRRPFAEDEKKKRESDRVYIEEGYYIDEMHLDKERIEQENEVAREKEQEEADNEVSSADDESEQELDDAVTSTKKVKVVESSDSSDDSSDSD